MKRLLNIVLICLCIILISTFSLIGCKTTETATADTTEETGESKATETTKSEESVKEPVTIQFWSGEDSQECIDVFSKWKTDFEALYPWITVDAQGLSESVYDKVITAIAAGGDVDIFTPSYEAISSLSAEGLLYPLDSAVDALGGRDIYINKHLFISASDNVEGISGYGGGAVMWVRTDIFEELGIPIPGKEGWTWEELYNAAEKATVDTDNDGKIDIYGIGLPYGQNTCTDLFTQMFMWNNGGAFFDENLDVVVDSPNNIEALEFYASLNQFAPPGAMEYSWYDVVDGFTSGAVAISMYEGRMISQIYNNNPSLKGKFTAVPIAHNKEFRSVCFDTPGYYCLYSGTKYPEECLLWMEFINRPENAAEFLATVPGHLLPETEETKEMLLAMNIPAIVENPDSMDVLLNFNEYRSGFNPLENAGGLDRENKEIVDTGVLNPYYTLISTSSYPSIAVQKIILENADAAAVVKEMSEALKKDVEEAK